MTFWNEIIHGFECNQCGKHYPRSVMVYIQTNFKGIDGKYCVCCSHKVFDQLAYCDECGEEYPKSHLFINALDKSTHCKNCIRMVDDEE